MAHDGHEGEVTGVHMGGGDGGTWVHGRGYGRCGLDYMTRER